MNLEPFNTVAVSLWNIQIRLDMKLFWENEWREHFVFHLFCGLFLHLIDFLRVTPHFFSFNWAERYKLFEMAIIIKVVGAKKTQKELEEKHNERTNWMREHKKNIKINRK
jgi:hypothetical protein